MLTVMCVFGTRPEAIKMAPVIKELQKHCDRVLPVVCVTAQHREMLDQVLELFGIAPQYDLNLMREGQSLAGLTERVLAAVDPVLAEVRPDWVLVQGDTTTAMAAALAAFYRNVRVGHVEAGLRTGDNRAPFPEEANRRIVSVLADLHFAPTEQARDRLLAEGLLSRSVIITGNTGIDALLRTREMVHANPPPMPAAMRVAIEGKRLLLVTGHRRENFGSGLEQACLALRELSDQFEDVCILYAVHMNPNVRGPVERILSSVPRLHLTGPLEYPLFVWLMDRATLILTDSGGIQEEAPALGKPVLVMREKTERPEAVAAGGARLVGTSRESIVRIVTDMLVHPDRFQDMSKVRLLYGDGRASEHIVAAILGATATS